MKKKENIFSVDAVRRQQEQERMQQKLSVKPAAPARKVPINLTLPADYKERLISYAQGKHLSASILVQMWIDEHCV